MKDLALSSLVVVSPTGPAPRLSAAFAALALSAAATLGSPAAAQVRLDEREPITRSELSGRVVLPDGSAAAGAVVTTSAGQRTITDADGSFRVLVELAPDVETVDVTASGNRRTAAGLVASARVTPAALAAHTSAGVLVLASAAPCHPRWLPTFGGLPGTDGAVNAFVEFDDGSGTALYAAGAFTRAGGVDANRIARWDGSRWSALGTGLNDTVRALAVFDDGAGGEFRDAGFGRYIARWDGVAWSRAGTHLNGAVYALAVFDDGTGPALFAGGAFSMAGGVPAVGIAKWDGTAWSAVGGGVGGSSVTVRALTVSAIGGSPALYCGGEFTLAGGNPANRIARWDGTAWSALGTGTSNAVYALAELGTGLYAAGGFTTAGGLPAAGIARWDGASWAALGSGTNRTVYTLTAFDDGGGPALYAGGDFDSIGGAPAEHVAKWSSSTWTPVGEGTNATVYALAVRGDGAGSALCAGGDFVSAGGLDAHHVAQWSSSGWEVLGRSAGAAVHALAVFDDGAGSALYVGGEFASVDGRRMNGIAAWDGSHWRALGSGVDHSTFPAVVNALAVFDDGGGDALYAGGVFEQAGGEGCFGIARWNGTSWSHLHGAIVGLGMTFVRALASFDDGSGTALYIAAENFVERWDGSTWSRLGPGGDLVYALAVFDDGSGPELYAAGQFASVGTGVARWNGAGWSLVRAATGISPKVPALAACDDGALFAGGKFTGIGGTPANGVARWNGSGWSALGSGVSGGVLGASVSAAGRNSRPSASGSEGAVAASW